MEIRLLVIRSAEPQSLAAFYSILGLQFDYHQHEGSPFHYSAMIGPTVLEIYPLTKSQAVGDKHLRLGIAIDDFDIIIEKLRKMEAQFVMEPAMTDFGFLAVVVDPEGRKVELYKK